MTLRELNRILREAEDDDGMRRLVAFLAVLRSIDQGEAATDEGIASSIDLFVKHYGLVSSFSVDKFMELGDECLNIDLPNELLLDILEAS